MVSGRRLMVYVLRNHLCGVVNRVSVKQVVNPGVDKSQGIQLGEILCRSDLYNPEGRRLCTEHVSESGLACRHRPKLESEAWEFHPLVCK